MKLLCSIVVYCFALAVAAQTPDPDAADVRDTYPFTWQYDLSIEVNGQKLPMSYHIEPGASYYGRSMELFPNVIEVTDVGRKLEFKTIGKTAKLSAYEEKPDKKVPKSRYKYTRLPEKTILGYRCIGLKAETDSEVAIIYFTNEAEAAYPELYKQLRVHNLVISLADYGFTDKSLLMLSDVTLKNKTGRAIITCTRFEQKPVVLRKSDYTWTAK
jgi:hypothetical protein